MEEKEINDREMKGLAECFIKEKPVLCFHSFLSKAVANER